MIWLTLIQTFFSTGKVRSWLTNPKVWIGVGVALVVSAGLLYRYHLIEKIETTSYQLAVAERALSDKKMEIMSLQTAVKTQKDRIDRAVAENRNLSKRLADTTKRNRSLSESYRQKINDVNKDSVLPTCEGSIDYLKRKAEDFK